VLASFGTDVLSGFLGGLASSLVALYLAYLFVDSRLHLKQRREDETQREAAREEMRTASLTAVHHELESAAALTQTLLAELPTGGIPYPGYDLTGWPLVSQAPVFTTLKPDTISALTHAYNRMSSANEQLAFLTDLNHGPTAILVNTVLADSLDKQTPLAEKAYEMFVNHRDKTRELLVDRVGDVKTAIDGAIDAVESELGFEVEHPAEEREYRSQSRP
jgi:hypothetical protein